MNWKDLPFIYQVRMNVGHGKLPLLTALPSVGDWVVAYQCIRRVTAVTAKTFLTQTERFRMQGREWVTGTRFSTHRAQIPSAEMIQAAEVKELAAIEQYKAYLDRCETARQKVLSFNMSEVTGDQFIRIAEILGIEVKK